MPTPTVLLGTSSKALVFLFFFRISLRLFSLQYSVWSSHRGSCTRRAEKVHQKRRSDILFRNHYGFPIPQLSFGLQFFSTGAKLADQFDHGWRCH